MSKSLLFITALGLAAAAGAVIVFAQILAPAHHPPAPGFATVDRLSPKKAPPPQTLGTPNTAEPVLTQPGFAAITERSADPLTRGTPQVGLATATLETSGVEAVSEKQPDVGSSNPGNVSPAAVPAAAANPGTATTPPPTAETSPRGQASTQRQTYSAYSGAPRETRSAVAVSEAENSLPESFTPTQTFSPAEENLPAPAGTLPPASSPTERDTPSAPPPSPAEDPPPAPAPRSVAAEWLLDSTLVEPPVDWGEYDVQELLIVYPYNLAFSRSYLDSKEIPPEDVLREKIESLPDAAIYCIDIEHWPLVHGDDVSDVDENLRKLTRILELFREVHPQAKLGYYGIFPRFDYAQASGYPEPVLPDAFRLQQERNRRADPLIAKVDILFPTAYAVPLASGRTLSYGIWLSRMQAVVAASREYGKPVYTFLWTEKDHRDGFWKNQVLESKMVSDKVVVWGTGDWSPEIRWFRETIEVLSTPASVPGNAFD